MDVLIKTNSTDLIVHVPKQISRRRYALMNEGILQWPDLLPSELFTHDGLKIAEGLVSDEYLPLVNTVIFKPYSFCLKIRWQQFFNKVTGEVPKLLHKVFPEAQLRYLSHKSDPYLLLKFQIRYAMLYDRTRPTYIKWGTTLPELETSKYDALSYEAKELIPRILVIPGVTHMRIYENMMFVGVSLAYEHKMKQIEDWILTLLSN